jgi:hypothetical protein
VKTIFRLVAFLIPISITSELLCAQSNTFPATGNVGIGTASPTAPLQVAGSANDLISAIGSSSGRAGIYVQCTNPVGQGTLYMDNNRGSFASYCGILSGSSADPAISLFGLSRADRGFVFADGASNLGLGVGTLTAQPLVFGTNNAERMRIDASGNVGIGITVPTQPLQVNGNILGTRFIGYGAGGITSNTAVGASSLAANTTGIFNTALGLQALQNNTVGFGNIATGTLAMGLNTSGNYNVAYGAQALFSNVSGTNNVANGYQALYFNSTGIDNVASGYQALYNNTGSYNTATGVISLFNNTSGNNNAAYGSGSLQNNISGISNTAIGFQALFNNSTGTNNVALGQTAGSAITTGSNNISIGFNAQVPTSTASGQLSIGNWIYGINGSIGIGTVQVNDPNYKLFVETGIRTRKIVVDQATWPDFVFKKGYRLPSLSGVKKYIEENGHLPGMPSADSIGSNGIDLGNNQAALLKKIEELTLYVIEQNRKLDDQNLELRSQQERIDRLESVVNRNSKK